MRDADFKQKDVRHLIRLALDEDLGAPGDVTTKALIPEHMTGSVQIVARETGVLAGLTVGRLVFVEIDPAVKFVPLAADGDALAAGTVVADLSGKVQSLLAGERTCLNFLKIGRASCRERG